MDTRPALRSETTETTETRPPTAAIPVTHRTARRGAVLGMAAAAAWVALGAESVARGGEMHYRDVLWLAPWTLTVLTFAHLHAVQRHRLPRWGRIAGIAVLVTMGLLLAGDFGVIFGIDGLALLAFPLGALLWLVAMVPFGVATARAGVVPRRVGIAIALLEPGSILAGVALSPIAGLHERGNFSGGLEKGLVVLMVAMALDAARTRTH